LPVVEGLRAPGPKRCRGSPRAALRLCGLSAQPQCPRRTDEGAGRAQTARHSGCSGSRAQPRHTEGRGAARRRHRQPDPVDDVPVRGPLFDFAPAIDKYLKTHLFGDIFERDNLDWESRELATVSMLSALSGAESQMQSHMRVSMNVGLTGTPGRVAQAPVPDLARRRAPAANRGADRGAP